MRTSDIRSMIRRAPWHWLAAAAAIGTVTLTAILLALLRADTSEERLQAAAAAESRSTASAAPFRSLLDGLPTERATSSRPVAVVIENHVDARPVSGLSSASLVFEAPVEGGITRLLALYDPERETSEIGPVRSARPYFLDWTREFDALFGHVGGSPEALDLIPRIGIRNLDQFFWSQYFWRAKTREAPHNVYTSSTLLREALADRDLADSSDAVQPWLFADADPASVATSTSEIAIPFSSPSYAVRWRWDPLQARYLRSVGGAVAEDRDGRRQVAANVAVAFVDSAVIDEVGRLRVRTAGSGRAVLFRDGVVTAGEWRKPGRSERLRFYDEMGEEFVWRPGMTWVEIVPKIITITVRIDDTNTSYSGED